MVSDLFGLFSSPRPEPAKGAQPAFIPMTAEQRTTIRRLFDDLGVRTSPEQFDLVDVLVGIRLNAVAELDEKGAARLIPRLRDRVASAQRQTTGNSWDDREEDTWIDRL